MSEWVRYFESTKRNIFNQCLANRRLIELIIEHTPKGGRILEAGCGTALLSLILANYGFAVTALDLSKEVLDYAQRRVFLNKIHLNFVQGNILKLSSMFRDKYFDTICHSGVMEHFRDNDIILSLSEQRKVSKIVIFKIPNNRVKLTNEHFGDERFLSNKKWVSLIKKSGFKEIRIFGDYDLPKYTYFLLPSVFFGFKLSFWRKYFSKHSIFVCK